MIDISALLQANGGFLLTHDYRSLRTTIYRLVKAGLLIRLIRGVVTAPDPDVGIRIRAALARYRGAVVAGETALALSLPHRSAPAVITLCTPTYHLPQPGYRLIHRTIPREHATGRVMSPILAAVDVCDTDPSWLDELAFRRFGTTARYDQIMREFAHRPGNRARRRHIARTSTTPRPLLERSYHELFDARGITGWVANQRLTVGTSTYYPDMAFDKEKLICECDGRAFHTDPDAFEGDRRRQNELTAAGWTILRFTYAMLADPDWVVGIVTTTRARLRGRRPRRGTVIDAATLWR
jgi:very-short-patch-repair endonuclease